MRALPPGLPPADRKAAFRLRKVLRHHSALMEELHRFRTDPSGWREQLVYDRANALGEAIGAALEPLEGESPDD